MCGIFTYTWLKFIVNVGKYSSSHMGNKGFGWLGRLNCTLGTESKSMKPARLSASATIPKDAWLGFRHGEWEKHTSKQNDQKYMNPYMTSQGHTENWGLMSWLDLQKSTIQTPFPSAGIFPNKQLTGEQPFFFHCSKWRTSHGPRSTCSIVAKRWGRMRRVWGS